MENAYQLTFSSNSAILRNNSSRIKQTCKDFLDAAKKSRKILNMLNVVNVPAIFSEQFKIGIINDEEVNKFFTLFWGNYGESIMNVNEDTSITKIEVKHIPLLIEKVSFEIERLEQITLKMNLFDNNIFFNNDCSAEYFSLDNFNSFESFNQYVKRGEFIRNDNSQHFQNILTLFSNIDQFKFGIHDNEVSHSEPLPFVFICCSSGTGKTQLPFCFPNDRPVLYFLFNGDKDINFNSQSIYKNFEILSKGLYLCLEKDFSMYSLKTENLSVTKFSRITMPLFTAGFLVALLTEYSRNIEIPSQNCASISYCIGLIKLKFRSLTWIEARDAIDELINAKFGGHHPLIFIDETYEFNSNDFLYLRTLIRIIHLIPIFMGTKFDMNGFLTEKKYNFSRPKTLSNRLYVIHQLPPISRFFLQDELNQLRAGVSADLKVVFLSFLDAIGGYLEKERPYFAIQIMQNIKNQLSSIKNFDRKNFFDEMLQLLYIDFYYVKEPVEFSLSQICFLVAKNNNQTCRRGITSWFKQHKLCGFKSEETEMDLIGKKEVNPENSPKFQFGIRHVHCHISFLSPPPDRRNQNMTYFALFPDIGSNSLVESSSSQTINLAKSYSIDQSSLILSNSMDLSLRILNDEKNSSADLDKALNRSSSSDEDFSNINRRSPQNYVSIDGTHKEYHLNSMFPLLRDSCLSSFAFNAMSSNIGSLFLLPSSKGRAKRFSIAAIFSIIANGKNSKAAFIQEHFENQQLESAVHAATIISSHIDGLENVTLDHFFRSLIRELNFGQKEFTTLPEVQYPSNDKLKEQLMEKVPYFANCDQLWNDEFLKFLKTMYPNALFGTAIYLSVGADLFLTSVNSFYPERENIFLTVEAKCWNAPMSPSSVSNAIEKLLSNSGRLFLLVAQKITPNLKDIYCENANILYLQRSGSNYQFVMNQASAETDRYLFILDMSVIYQGSHQDYDSYFENWK